MPKVNWLGLIPVDRLTVLLMACSISGSSLYHYRFSLLLDSLARCHDPVNALDLTVGLRQSYGNFNMLDILFLQEIFEVSRSKSTTSVRNNYLWFIVALEKVL